MSKEILLELLPFEKQIGKMLSDLGRCPGGVHCKAVRAAYNAHFEMHPKAPTAGSGLIA